MMKNPNPRKQKRNYNKALIYATQTNHNNI